MTELEADIRTRYDIETFTARHPQAQIFRWVNDAYRDLRDRLTADGSLLFLQVVEDTCTETGVSAIGVPGTVLDATLGSFEIWEYVKEVHAKIGSAWVPLEEISIMDALTRTDLSSNGVPRYWFLAGVNRTSEATGGANASQAMRIAVSPPNDAARSFRIVGVQYVVDLVATDKLFTDLGLQEYLIRWNGVLLANRDDDVQLWQARKAELQECYQDILRRSKNRTPGRSVRSDTRTRGTRYVR